MYIVKEYNNNEFIGYSLFLSFKSAVEDGIKLFSLGANIVITKIDYSNEGNLFEVEVWDSSFEECYEKGEVEYCPNTLPKN